MNTRLRDLGDLGDFGFMNVFIWPFMAIIKLIRQTNIFEFLNSGPVRFMFVIIIMTLLVCGLCGEFVKM